MCGIHILSNSTKGKRAGILTLMRNPGRRGLTVNRDISTTLIIKRNRQQGERTHHAAFPHVVLGAGVPDLALRDALDVRSFVFSLIVLVILDLSFGAVPRRHDGALEVKVAAVAADLSEGARTESDRNVRWGALAEKKKNSRFTCLPCIMTPNTPPHILLDAHGGGALVLPTTNNKSHHTK